MKQSLAWHIGPDAKPTRLNPGTVNLEKDLEDWLTDDIDIVADDILVISRQAITSWGTRLDLLALDAEGNLVIVEIKRDQTLRDTVAQAIEYAAWASQLSYEDIRILAEKHFGKDAQLEIQFNKRFAADLPDILNQSQRIMVVAPSIDDVTETVVNYLADAFKLPINAVGFDVFGEPGNLTLVRQFVREQGEIVTPPTSKKKPARTLEEILESADQNRVREIAVTLLTLKDIFPVVKPYFLTFNLQARTADGRTLAGLSVYPTAETRANQVELLVGYPNLCELFQLSQAAIDDLTTALRQIGTRIDYNSPGWDKLTISSVPQAEAICAALRNVVKAPPA